MQWRYLLYSSGGEGDEEVRNAYYSHVRGVEQASVTAKVTLLPAMWTSARKSTAKACRGKRLIEYI